ncbi:MAG: WhiB family transcriptional regulator [Streptosporangiales bacterium]
MSCRTTATDGDPGLSALGAVNWRQAACRGEDPELFDFDRYELFAKAVCARCPVRQRCLDYALRHAVSGVWGGTSDAERSLLRRRLGIAAAPLSWNDSELPVLAAGGMS